MEFKGFLLMENNIKEQTIPILNDLEVHGIRNIMITGDNLNTAISVASKCGMINDFESLTNDNYDTILNIWSQKNLNNTIISDEKYYETLPNNNKIENIIIDQ